MSGDATHEKKSAAGEQEQEQPAAEGGNDLKHAALQRRARNRKDEGGGEEGGEDKAAHGKVTDLGMLEKPGAKLGGSAHTLAPGEALRFSDGENQIWGLGQIKVTPAHLATMDNQTLENYKDHTLGSMSRHQYTLTVSPKAKSGEKITVHTAGDFQSRNDPSWAFSFVVHVK